MTLLTPEKLNNLLNALRDTDGVPGVIAEVGVFEGGTLRAMIDATPEHEGLYLAFDTFKGLPQPTEIDHHKRGEFCAPLETVLKACPEATLVPGLFPQTWAPVRLRFAHLDIDLYEGTRDAIPVLWDSLSVGGILFLDDYNWKQTPGVTVAVGEWLKTPRNNMAITVYPHQISFKKLSTF